MKDNSFTKSLQEILHQGGKILSCYYILGYPTIEESINRMENIAKYADIIEIGIPFSDPIADGPIIQEKSLIALQNKITMKDIKLAIQRLRNYDVKIILMSYANIFYQNNEFSTLDIDAIIIPDVTFEHNLTHLNDKITYIISPNTPENRIIKNIQKTNGFIYLISQLSITGSRFKGDDRNRKIIEKVRNIDNKIIVLAGFGITSTSDVRYLLKQGIDGIIIGSVLLNAEDNYLNKVKQIKEALNA